MDQIHGDTNRISQKMISNLENAIDCNNLSCMPKIGANLYTATARIISIVLHFRKYHI